MKNIDFFKENPKKFGSIDIAIIVFLLCFLLENVAFFGVAFAENKEDFFLFVLYFVPFAGGFNILLCIIFLISGIYQCFDTKNYFNSDFKAILILCINIPVAILYIYLFKEL